MRFKDDEFEFNFPASRRDNIYSPSRYFKNLKREFKYGEINSKVLVYVEAFANCFEKLLRKDNNASLEKYFLEFVNEHKDFRPDHIYLIFYILHKVWFLGDKLQDIYDKNIANFSK